MMIAGNYFSCLFFGMFYSGKDVEFSFTVLCVYKKQDVQALS